MEDWFEFNDVNVKKLDPTDVQQCFDFAKRAEAGELPTSFDDTPLRPEARASKSKPLSAPEIKASSETEGVDASTSAPETKAAEAEGAEAPASVEEPETPVALSLPAFNMSTNAYLVMYRKIDTSAPKDVDMPAPLQAMVCCCVFFCCISPCVAR